MGALNSNQVQPGDAGAFHSSLAKAGINGEIARHDARFGDPTTRIIASAILDETGSACGIR